jgi:AmpD protein
VTKRAWHAGESCHNGRSACNDFSIGIELEGDDDVPYEDAQYQQLLELIEVLMRAYPTIPADGVVGHVDIAPGRKTDPGLAFDWSYLRKKLATKLASSGDVDNT